MRHFTGLVLLLLSLNPAQAHLMVAQHGTLNLVGDGVFMVLSLPVSAFAGTDDDGDGRLSNTEFSKHRLNIVSAINKHIRLTDADGPRPLEGMLLTPVVPHDDPKAPVEQLVVMGRFVLAQSDAGNTGYKAKLSFHAELFGQQESERVLTVTATDKANAFKHKMVLTPGQDGAQPFTVE